MERGVEELGTRFTVPSDGEDKYKVAQNFDVFIFLVGSRIYSIESLDVLVLRKLCLEEVYADNQMIESLVAMCPLIEYLTVDTSKGRTSLLKIDIGTLIKEVNEAYLPFAWKQTLLAISGLQLIFSYKQQLTHGETPSCCQSLPISCLQNCLKAVMRLPTFAFGDRVSFEDKRFMKQNIV
ncbi:hypothetical protein Pint_28420 [Pistacia integerrima]|uniref:Uncharacterized protein n=1 Tax=Pistacia integerrima TaxID=434235 RepID=A0ACC0YQ40_9ROSI|nr:hypothetical protein Pint_28420 [Pistacia integerrima]